MYWPSNSNVNTSRLRSEISLQWPMGKVNKLFIIWPFHFGPESVINLLKPTGQQTTLRKHSTSMSCTILSPPSHSGGIGRWIPYMTAVNIIDHNMDVHKGVHYLCKYRLYMPHQACNARSLQQNNAKSLQENGQSERVYCSHIMIFINALCKHWDLFGTQRWSKTTGNARVLLEHSLAHTVDR